jgi:cell wall-associated NlpC family hydrolase
MSTRFSSRLFTFALVAVVAYAAVAPGLAIGDDGRDLRDAHSAPPAEEEIPTKGERAAEIALKAVGVPYRWGGESPAVGFDCSGLVRWAYGRVGIDLPHSSYALYGEGRRVSTTRMEPGDVLFFEGLGHVGLYLGRGRMVHAPQTGRSVEVVRLGEPGYGGRLIGARRVTPT